MSWFKRKTKGIQTSTEEKKDIPQGLWYKSPTGKIIETEELAQNFYISPEDGYHVRIGSKEYFEILFDGKFSELDKTMRSKDPLDFEDTKKYKDRLKEAQKKTDLYDAVRCAVGKSKGRELVVACMDFDFIGGSLGSVMGEKIRRAIDFCIEKKLPYMIICQSGGARMQEGILSLMQMAKTSGAVKKLNEAGIPFISVPVDPTTGGVTASFAMLGDVIITEPNTLIAFAGPRVIEQTVNQKLPKGFQRAEFLLEHGMIDIISERKDLKTTIYRVLEKLV